MSRMPSSLRIESASRDDIATLIELMGEFYAESNFPLPTANARRAFEQLLSDPRLGGVWIAFGEDGAAGYVVLTLAFGMEYGGMRGFIDDLFVRPSARRRGVAAALLDALIADCLTRGVRSLSVEVAADNVAGNRVYERAGLANEGRLLLSRGLASPLHEPAER
jgi:GNAT superfamily N-acetyltransferase